jgi:FkbM family methyltransferase
MILQANFTDTTGVEPRRFAVITPYYREERKVLERCVQSVRHQTVAADHFLVSDGFPQDWLDSANVRHIRLGRAHNDVGSTPRGLGALLAVSERYDGIGLLDADNWYDENHIEECCKAADSIAPSPTDVVFAKRRIFLPDGKPVKVPEELNHVDTSCYWFLPGSFHLLHYWAIMPSGMGPAGDRIFYRILTEQSLIIRKTERITVNFTSNYESHYRFVGVPPPPDAKPNVDMTTVFAQIKQIDSRQRELIRRRCGLDILSPVEMSRPFNSGDSLCFCGSGKRFKHCHGREARRVDVNYSRAANHNAAGSTRECDMERQPAFESDRLKFVEIALSTGGQRRFFYRENSRTDRNVIHQIFELQHYNIAQFPLSRSLKNYANQVSANGASLLVVDAGANIGASAVYLTQLDPRIHVCAIEPEPEKFSVLKTNCFDLPIVPIEAALASERSKLWLADPGIGEWGFRVGESSGILQVAAITMADVLGRFDASRLRPLICKIDIEGGEKDLFRSNVSWIDQFPLIVVEFHDWLLPGTSNSKNCLHAISERNFDVIFRGENVFCFNNDLLSNC